MEGKEIDPRQNMPASDFHEKANVDIYYHEGSLMEVFRRHTQEGNADMSGDSIEEG